MGRTKGKSCTKCNGAKIVVTKAGRNKFESTCPRCGGSGKEPIEKD